MMRHAINHINIGNMDRLEERNRFLDFYNVAKESNIPDNEIVEAWNKYAKFPEQHVWLTVEKKSA